MPEAPDQPKGTPFADAPLDGLIGEPTGGPDDKWQGELIADLVNSGLSVDEWQRRRRAEAKP